MDILTLNAAILVRDSETDWVIRNTSACDFDVTSNGVKLETIKIPLSGTAVLLPSAPQGLFLTIRANPSSPRLWPVQAHFMYVSPGNLIPMTSIDDPDPTVEDSAFQTPTSIQFPVLASTPLGKLGGQTVLSMQVFLSRIRDVTQKVEETFSTVPDSILPYVGDPSLLSIWPSLPLEKLHFIKDNILDDSNHLDFELADSFPNSTDRVFEVAGVGAPQLISMRWSNAVPLAQTPEPTSFLVYLHPDLVQSGSYTGVPYPFGPEYLFWILWRDSNYVNDPLTLSPGPKGLNYQVHHSGKKVVLINPLPRLQHNPEPGVMLVAEEMESLLREIQAFMYRRNEVYQPPGIKRVALSAFSDGCGLWLNSFLFNNRSHSFLRHFLKEIYLFDPRMNAESLVELALQWANNDPANKRIRVYMTNHDKTFSRIIDKKFAFPAHSFAKNSDDGLRTVVSTRIPDWVKASAAFGGSPEMEKIINHFGPVHELQPGTMATHALKLSGFD